MTQPLSPDTARTRVQDVPGWRISDDGDAMSKTFQFANFSEAFAFMSRSALMAEKLDHHPDWSNVYATVEVRLSTHDAGGLTDKDFQLAEAMNDFAKA